jgi:aminopeptidase
MSKDMATLQQLYAEVIVKIGLNIQPGQRLLIGAPILWVSGAPIQSAFFIDMIAAEAYKAGASLVDVIWNDDDFQLTRFRHAPKDSFSQYPQWQVDAAMDYAEKGDALLFIFSETPDLFKDQDQQSVAEAQAAAFKHTQPVWECYARRSLQGVVISIPTPGWAAKVFPGMDVKKQEAMLWNSIFEVCRLNETDPLKAWDSHVKQLDDICSYLNNKQFKSLHFTAPGTDLTLGLPKGHNWTSSCITTSSGIKCVTGFPCEEIFTLPHKDEAEGFLTATKPMSYGGALIENLKLTFSGGKVVKATASKGEDIILKLLDTDEGARRLGEVSLLPHSSPVSKTGQLFYNILVDENAANHLAVGRAYRFNLMGGEELSDDALHAAGGNLSAIHADFMIGSADMNVDGLDENGNREAVMRNGEWAF